MAVELKHVPFWPQVIQERLRKCLGHQVSYRFVIFGAPGAGKGTQSSGLAEAFGIPHISTGEMFRRAIKEKTPLGVRADTFIRVGKLVPDETVIEMVKERLLEADCEKGFLLDGFPRTNIQAEMLDAMLAEEQRALVAVIDLEVPWDVLRERLAGRRICSKCNTSYHLADLAGALNCPLDQALLIQREDDSLEAIDVRLKLFENQTGKLKDYYEKRNLLLKINGNQKPDVVFNEIKRKIDQKMRK